MIDEKTRRIFSEIDAFLNIIDEKYKNRIPMQLRNLYKDEKSKSYMPKYDPSIQMEKQNIQRETIAMIALLHLNYWCDSEEEKNKIRKILNENEIKYQKKLQEQYNPDNLFKNEEKRQEDVVEKLAIVEYKENFIKKIINAIKKLFKH